MFKSTTIHHDKYEGLFSLSLDLKALIEGAIFVSKSRLFERLAPQYTTSIKQPCFENLPKFLPIAHKKISSSDLDLAPRL